MKRKKEPVLIPIILFLLAGVPIVSADSIPHLVWYAEDHPWSIGTYGSRNQLGGGRLDYPTEVWGEFQLAGTDQPAVIAWTYWSYGAFQSFEGFMNPYDIARLELKGAGTIKWVSSDGPPYSSGGPLSLWTLDETSGYLDYSGQWKEFEVEPRQVLFTIQPGYDYLVQQFNWGKLNFYDLGYSEATLESSIELVPDLIPEPCTLSLLGTGLGMIGLVGWRRRK